MPREKSLSRLFSDIESDNFILKCRISCAVTVRQKEKLLRQYFRLEEIVCIAKFVIVFWKQVFPWYTPGSKWKYSHTTLNLNFDSVANVGLLYYFESITIVALFIFLKIRPKWKFRNTSYPVISVSYFIAFRRAYITIIYFYYAFSELKGMWSSGVNNLTF